MRSSSFYAVSCHASFYVGLFRSTHRAFDRKASKRKEHNKSICCLGGFIPEKENSFPSNGNSVSREKKSHKTRVNLGAEKWTIKFKSASERRKAFLCPQKV